MKNTDIARQIKSTLDDIDAMLADGVIRMHVIDKLTLSRKAADILFTRMQKVESAIQKLDYMIERPEIEAHFRGGVKCALNEIDPENPR